MPILEIASGVADHEENLVGEDIRRIGLLGAFAQGEKVIHDRRRPATRPDEAVDHRHDPTDVRPVAIDVASGGIGALDGNEHERSVQERQAETGELACAVGPFLEAAVSQNLLKAGKQKVGRVSRNRRGVVDVEAGERRDE